MVREGLNHRQPSAVRSKRNQLIAFGILGLLVVTCLLSLGGKAGQQAHTSASWQAGDSHHRRSGPQAGLLPNLVAATRSTLDAVSLSSSSRGRAQETPGILGIKATLVVYLYSAEDRIHKSNLRFFVRWGLADVPGLEYLFVVANKTADTVLPALPHNAKYWETEAANCVYGLGVLGEALKANRQKHDYYIFTGSYVRGPFLPTFLEGQAHWTQYFVHRLQGDVKLVGPSISCQEPEFHVNSTDPYALAPYVQFLTMATDAAGLALMEKEVNAFQCHNNTKMSRFWGERGAARGILRAGFTLDSFLMRYRGVDWTNQSNWNCNARIDPVPEWRYDGISVNPFEIMFVPMDLMIVENGWTYAKQATVYDFWLSQKDANRHDILSNTWEHDSMPIKRQRMAYVQSRGPGCFDTAYYLAKNKDLFVIPTPLQLWDHFVTNGQFEGRSFRWSCEDDRRLPWEK